MEFVGILQNIFFLAAVVVVVVVVIAVAVAVVMVVVVVMVAKFQEYFQNKPEVHN